MGRTVYNGHLRQDMLIALILIINYINLMVGIMLRSFMNIM